MTQKKISSETYSSDLVDFSHQVEKITLHDHGKANITIGFGDPALVSKIYFLQAPRVPSHKKPLHAIRLISMIKNNLIGLPCDRFNSSMVHDEPKRQSFDISLLSTDQTDLSLFIGLSSLDGYSVIENGIIENAEYLVPVEDLREGAAQKNRRSKNLVYYNKSGETSHNVGHHHRYVIDKNGNGMTVEALDSEGSAGHRHIIINFAIKSAQGQGAWTPHTHKLDQGILEYLKGVEALATQMMDDEQPLVGGKNADEQEKDQQIIY